MVCDDSWVGQASRAKVYHTRLGDLTLMFMVAVWAREYFKTDRQLQIELFLCQCSQFEKLLGMIDVDSPYADFLNFFKFIDKITVIVSRYSLTCQSQSKSNR